VTAFADTPAERQRLDWQLLSKGAVALYASPRVLDEDVAWLTSYGYRTATFRTEKWTTAESMHTALASTLNFPDYYGRNLDALKDVLGDVEVPDKGGLVLVLTRFDDFATRHQKLAWSLLDLFANHSRLFALTGRRFLVICQSNDSTLAIAPFGARSLAWNPRESTEFRFPAAPLSVRAACPRHGGAAPGASWRPN
jgi:RNAse (barnase) inhibitor barstar